MQSYTLSQSNIHTSSNHVMTFQTIHYDSRHDWSGYL